MSEVKQRTLEKMWHGIAHRLRHLRRDAQGEALVKADRILETLRATQRACNHDVLVFWNGGYYVGCDRCGARWVACLPDRDSPDYARKDHPRKGTKWIHQECIHRLRQRQTG